MHIDSSTVTISISYDALMDARAALELIQAVATQSDCEAYEAARIELEAAYRKAVSR